MLRIKTSNIFDTFVLIFLFLHVLILRWLNLPWRCSEILFVLLLFALVRNIYSLAGKFYFWLAIVIAIWPFLSIFWAGGTLKIAYSNTFRVTLSILIIMYISLLLSYKKEFLYDFLMKSCIPLNVYMVINIPIIYLQSQGYYWLSGFSNFTNTLKEDMMSGLLGFNGTPYLAMFMVFLILLNVLYSEQIKLVSNRRTFLVYNISLIGYSLILPLYNDNKGFYVELGFAVLLLFLYKTIVGNSLSLHNANNNVVRIFILTVVVLLIGFLVLRYTRIGDIFTSMIDKLVSGYMLANNSSGSGERFGMITYALRSSELRTTGYGLARMKWTQSNGFGFAHFGQSDCGVFLILGGVIYLVMILLFVFLISKRHIKSNLFSLLMTGFFLITMIYTRLFTTTTLMISTTFIWALIILSKERTSQQRLNSTTSEYCGFQRNGTISANISSNVL